MNELLWGSQGLAAAQIGGLFVHFLVLSLLAVGGAMTTAPDMQRFVVVQHGWLSDAQFTASVALAQAAPGPNVLFVAVVGFNVAGLAGAGAALAGTLLPSSTLAVAAARLEQRHRHTRAVRAFTAGLAPTTLGLLLATGWILLEPTQDRLASWALVAGTLLLMWGTRLNPLWAIGAGALAGALGWV